MEDHQHHTHLCTTSTACSTTAPPTQPAAPLAQPAAPPVQPGPVPQLNWSHFKPEFARKTDEGAEAHLLSTND